jgi:CRISPR system Cascade subunit CasE
MFLSKLVLNVRNPQARRDLARPYELHRTLLSGYPHPRVVHQADLLFRVEPSRAGPPAVLVQTRQAPDWSSLPGGYLLGRPECKPLTLPVTAGRRLPFRLRANPTKRVAANNERLGGVMAGKRVGLITEAEQVRWLLRKGEANGFTIPGGWVDARHPETGEPIQLPNFRLDVVPEGRDRNGKPGHGGAFLAVRFEGVLVVTVPEAFRAAVAAGVGSGKAFGFGLLSLAAPHGGEP